MKKPNKKDFIEFCIKKMVNLVSKNSTEDPTFKTVKSIMIRYKFDEDKAWTAYKPIFWYLSCDKKIISVELDIWSIKPAYKKIDVETKAELLNGILRAYGKDLDVRLR